MEDLLVVLSRYGENAGWIREHYEELRGRFRDEWVAVMDCRVVDHDRDLRRLVDRLRERYPESYSQIAIEFIAGKEIELMLWSGWLEG